MPVESLVEQVVLLELAAARPLNGFKQMLSAIVCQVLLSDPVVHPSRGLTPFLAEGVYCVKARSLRILEAPR